MRKPTTLLLVLAAGLSCSKDTTGPKGPGPVAVVHVIPDSATVDVFDTLQLRIVALDASGDTVFNPGAIGWMSAAPDTVSVSSIGRVQGLRRGTVTITASAGGVSGTARLKVKVNVIRVLVLSVGLLGPVPVTDSVQFVAFLYTANGQRPDDSIPIWHSSDTTKVTVSSTGVVAGLAQGSATVSAQADTAVGSVLITVPEPMSRFLMSSRADTVRQDSTAIVSAVPVGAAGDTLNSISPSWSISDSSIAFPEGVGVGAQAVIGRVPGRAVLRVSYLHQAADSCVIIVVRPSVAKVGITPDTGTKILPASFDVHATTQDSVGVQLTGRAVTWAITDTSLATLSSDTGVDVVVTGKKDGRAKVVATSEGRVDTATLRFVHPSVATVTVSPDTGTYFMTEQSFAQFGATVLDSVGDYLTDRIVSWQVADTSIAQVSAPTGPAVNFTANAIGLALVVASSEGRADTARIKIIRRSVASVAVSPDSGTFNAENFVDLGVVLRDSLGQGIPLTGRVIHWSVLDTAIAAIADSVGPSVNVTIKAGGTARFVATCEGKTDTATLHFVRPSVAKVVLLPVTNGKPVDTSAVLLSTVRILEAQTLDSTGTPLNRTITFTSSDSAVALPAVQLVEVPLTQATVTGKASGTAVVTVASEGKAVTWHASVYSVTYDTAAGGAESCANATGGAVYCWGIYTYPTPVAATTGLHAIAAKAGYACGLDPSGNAFCWGVNGFGLGTAPGLATNDSARAVLGGLQFSQIDVGGEHLCGITLAGGVACWGGNDHAQLGTGDSATRATPTLLSTPVVFAKVSTGYFHTCALSTGGTIYCWGANGPGTSGQPLGGNVVTPRAVDSTVAFTAVSAGYDHTCALTAVGDAYCWGGNSQGQLGNGDTTSTSTPALVPGGLTFKSIAAGLYATCGITTGGTAYCWGTDFSSALGNGSLGFTTTPGPVSGGLTFTDITMAIVSPGSICGKTTTGVYCWGNGATWSSDYALPARLPGQP